MMIVFGGMIDRRIFERAAEEAKTAATFTLSDTLGDPPALPGRQ
jgi:hypothetical protein